MFLKLGFSLNLSDCRRKPAQCNGSSDVAVSADNVHVVSFFMFGFGTFMYDHRDRSTSINQRVNLKCLLFDKFF